MKQALEAGAVNRSCQRVINHTIINNNVTQYDQLRAGSHLSNSHRGKIFIMVIFAK